MPFALRDVCWKTLSFIAGYHLVVLIGLPIYLAYRTPAAGLVAVAVALLVLTEVGIGAAYHRFYAHRTYSPGKPAEAVLLFLATLATQGTALQWAHDHRRHHAHVDTDDDPYSIRKGFWYAHLLWMFEKLRPMDPRIVTDLAANKLVMLQHRAGHMLSMVTNVVLCGLVGWAFGDVIGGLFIVWLTRLLVSHHLTWSVNSLAHTWGERTYSREHSAVDNYVLALVTVGEGYHNFHHTFPSDYRNGIRWYHFDPNKWTIWLLGKLGLARDLKRVDDYSIKARLLREDKRLLSEHLKTTFRERAEELEHKLEGLFETLHDALNHLAKMTKEAQALKRQGERRLARDIRRRIKEQRQALRQTWRDWHRLCGAVLALPAAA